MDEMDEHDVAAMYIAEMGALLPLVGHHLATLRASEYSSEYSSEEERRLAALELAHLGTAITDLCDGLHADDCAQAAAFFASCFAEGYSQSLHSGLELCGLWDLGCLVLMEADGFRNRLLTKTVRFSAWIPGRRDRGRKAIRAAELARVERIESDFIVRVEVWSIFTAGMN